MVCMGGIRALVVVDIAYALIHHGERSETLVFMDAGGAAVRAAKPRGATLTWSTWSHRHGPAVARRHQPPPLTPLVVSPSHRPPSRTSSPSHLTSLPLYPLPSPQHPLEQGKQCHRPHHKDGILTVAPHNPTGRHTFSADDRNPALAHAGTGILSVRVRRCPFCPVLILSPVLRRAHPGGLLPRL